MQNKFKVGDRVVYANPEVKNHKWNGEKATVLEVIQLKEYEDRTWYGHDSSYSIVIQFHTLNISSAYISCVFKLDNSHKIKERLGIK